MSLPTAKRGKILKITTPRLKNRKIFLNRSNTILSSSRPNQSQNLLKRLFHPPTRGATCTKGHRSSSSQTTRSFCTNLLPKGRKANTNIKFQIISTPNSKLILQLRQEETRNKWTWQGQKMTQTTRRLKAKRRSLASSSVMQISLGSTLPRNPTFSSLGNQGKTPSLLTKIIKKAQIGSTRLRMRSISPQKR